MFGFNVLGVAYNIYEGLMNEPGGCTCWIQKNPVTWFNGTSIAADQNGFSPLTGELNYFTCIELEVFKVHSE